MKHRMLTGDWLAGEVCEQSQMSFCMDCAWALKGVDLVWFTAGWGAAFHASKDGDALASGWKTLAAKGGVPADLQARHAVGCRVRQKGGGLSQLLRP